MKAIEVEKKSVPNKKGLKKGFSKNGSINGVNVVNWGNVGTKRIGAAVRKIG